MEYVMIWLGSKLPRRAAESAERVNAGLRDCDTLHLITDAEMPEIVTTITDSPWGKAWDRMHERIVDSPAPHPFNRWYAESDFIRLFLATSMPDMCYLDFDVTIKEALPETNGPWFAPTAAGTIDHCLFAVAGNTVYFEELLGLYCGATEYTRRTLYCLNNRMSPKVLPSTSFTHEGMAKWRRA